GLGTSDADIDLGRSEGGHDVHRAAASDRTDVEHQVWQAGGQVMNTEQHLGEGNDRVAPVLRVAPGVRLAAVAGQGEDAGPLARADEIAVFARGFENEGGVEMRGGALDERTRG